MEESGLCGFTLICVPSRQVAYEVTLVPLIITWLAVQAAQGPTGARIVFGMNHGFTQLDETAFGPASAIARTARSAEFVEKARARYVPSERLMSTVTRRFGTSTLIVTSDARIGLPR